MALLYSSFSNCRQPVISQFCIIHMSSVYIITLPILFMHIDSVPFETFTDIARFLSLSPVSKSSCALCISWLLHFLTREMQILKFSILSWLDHKICNNFLTCDSLANHPWEAHKFLIFAAIVMMSFPSFTILTCTAILNIFFPSLYFSEE